MTNSFDGCIKNKNGKYASTKENGFAIGFESIRITVWVTSIYNSESENPVNKFSVNVDRFMIQ
jgi:hypothetical protein